MKRIGKISTFHLLPENIIEVVRHEVGIPLRKSVVCVCIEAFFFFLSVTITSTKLRNQTYVN